MRLSDRYSHIIDYYCTLLATQSQEESGPPAAAGAGGAQYYIILEQAPQGIGRRSQFVCHLTLTQIHPILPKSNQNLDLEPLNIDLMSDLVNPCAIRAAGDQQ